MSTKANRTKLLLSRETVVVLSKGVLPRVVGGGSGLPTCDTTGSDPSIIKNTSR